MTPTELLAHYGAQAEQPAWQHELRQSVRLRLALTESGLNIHAVAAALSLVEDELRRQLLASHPASADAPEAVATAVEVMQHAQRALLGQRTEHEALRHALPMTEFAVALRRTCRPPAMGWRQVA